MNAEGQHVNHKAVARHMQVMGLRAIYPGPNSNTPSTRICCAG
ncbi:MAG: transposase [Anaerolinea sp.]|nr:transposase [Anaerolinea sp.]